MAADPSAHAF